MVVRECLCDDWTAGMRLTGLLNEKEGKQRVNTAAAA